MKRNKKGNVGKVKIVNLKDKMIFAFSFFVFLCVIGLTVGFSAFYKNMSIDMSAIVRVDKDVRITGIGDVQLVNEDSGSIILSTDYNHNNVNGRAVFQEGQPEVDGDEIETVELTDGLSFQFVVKNLGSEKMGIANITMSNSGLSYNLYNMGTGNYNSIGKPLCDINDTSKCTLGSVTAFSLVIYPKEGVVGGVPYEYELEFDFQPFQSVSCESGVCSSSYSTEVMKTMTYTTYVTVSSADYLKVTMGGVTLTQGTDYTYTASTGKLSIPNVSGDIYISEEVPVVFEDGEAVYFDVKAGTGCSESDYNEENSVDGYAGITSENVAQTSCLKFYAFNDTESAAMVNLLLDHNITPDSSMGLNLQWSSVDAINGPEVCGTPECILSALSFISLQWNGMAAIMESYEHSYYTINYEELGTNARLITAEEIAEIVGLPNYDPIQGTYQINFDSGFGWLTDRTTDYCTENGPGCYNNNTSGQNTYYWTATQADGMGADCVWVVDDYGMWEYDYDDYEIGIGLRPVIEVDKAKLD